MKFEHILQIYWTKGYFFGGKLFYFDQTIDSLLSNTPGLGYSMRNKLVSRFELTTFMKYNRHDLITDFQKKKHKPMERALNIMFSQINSVNNQSEELKRFQVIRLYLIRSYRGRCHALGKPVRGQRTWSNAWSSYNNNKLLRSFISETKRLIQQTKKEEKINYKLVKKKYASKKKKKKNFKKKTNRMILKF